MEIVLYILAMCVRIFLDVLSMAMMIRCLLPLFFDVEENRLFMLSVAITEPFIAPVRFILDKFGIGEDTPIDMGFMATWLVLILLDIFLPPI